MYILKFIILSILLNSIVLANIQKVSLQLQWKHQFEFAGFYAAKELGYYKDAGLEVELLEYKNGIDTIKEVESGKIEFGTSDTQIIKNWVKGSPLVLLADYFKQSPYVLATRTDIKSPYDLVGKKLMASPKNLETLVYIQMFQTLKIDPKSITLVAPSYNIQDFIDEKVDAYPIFLSDEPYTLNKQKVNYNTIHFSNYGFDLFDLALFTSQEFVKKYPKLTYGFIEASKKGWEYAFEHKEEIVELILKKYNTQNKTREALMFEAKKIEKLFLTNVYPIGSIDKNRVINITNAIKQIYKDTPTRTYDSLFLNKTRKVLLSKQEKEFLQKNPIIKVSSETDWPPYDFVQDGKPKGYSIDYMNLLSQKLGVKFEYTSDTWANLVDLFCRGKIQVLHPTDRSKKVTSCGDFSTRIIRDSTQYLTRKEFKKIESIEDLYGMRVSSPKGWAQTEKLRQINKFTIVEVTNIEEAMDAVSQGIADFTIGYGNVLKYMIKIHGFNNLKAQGYWNDDNTGLNDLYIATPKTEPILASIIQKTINTITAQEIQEIQTKWFGKEEKIDYSLFWKIGIIVFILLLIIIYWNYKLKLQVKKQIDELRSKDTLILEQSKNAAMGELIANIAHQWRQPLASLSGVVLMLDVELKKEKQDQNKLDDYLNDMEEYIAYMSETIEDFHNYFNPKKERSTFIIDTLTNDIEKLFKYSLIKYKIGFNLNIDTSFELHTYYSELLQVLLILINNAKDACITNNIIDPHIELNIKKNRSRVILEVVDNAGGIPNNIINRIFEPYFTTKYEKQGIGLGLHIAKTVIEKSLNGTITVENRSKGAIFTIELKK